MRFEFATTTRIIFGPGTLKEIGSVAKEFGQRALVVIGRNPARAERLLSLLREQHISFATFSVSGEPEIGTVEKGVAIAKQEKCELVISLGGGSVLDTGKAIAAMLTNPGELLDYLEVVGRAQPLAKPPAPFVAISTTAGTGSEVTRNAVLGLPQYRVKVSLRSALMLPKVAIVDPELTYDLPPNLTASTGLDALTQLIEPYLCSRANPMTDALCVDAMRCAARSLRTAFENGADKEARQQMSFASLCGGMALANAGLGAVHGFAGPLGGMYDAPHGDLCAALLPHVMEVNLRALQQRQPQSNTLDRFGDVARFLSGNPTATAVQGIEWLRKLVADLHISPLRAYGISVVDKTQIVENASKASSMKANPIALTSEELGEILERAI